jgi:hypothetical protein
LPRPKSAWPPGKPSNLRAPVGTIALSLESS